MRQLSCADDDVGRAECPASRRRGPGTARPVRRLYFFAALAVLVGGTEPARAGETGATTSTVTTATATTPTPTHTQTQTQTKTVTHTQTQTTQTTKTSTSGSAGGY